jgi:two-component system, NarL family, sensor kinase
MRVIRFALLINFLLLHLIQCYSRTAANKDTIQLNKYFSSTSYYLSRNPDSAYYFADKALKLSIRIESLKHKSIADQYLGYYFTEKENFGKAIEYFLEALKIEERRNDEKRIADLKNDLGNIYQLMEKFNKALHYYNDALGLYEKQKDTAGIAQSLFHIGHLHSSREYCETRSKKQKAVDYFTALAYFEKSIKLFEEARNYTGVANCNQNFAAVYNKLEKPALAYPYLLKALKYFRATNNWQGITGTLYGLGSTYRRLKQYNKSIDCYNECVSISEKRNLNGGIQFLYEAMSQTYDDAGKYKLARDYYIKYMTLRDSVYNNEKSKQIFELETKYQTEKKEKAILSLNLEKKKKNQFIFLLISVIILLVLTGIYIIYTIRRKRIIAELASEIKDQKILQLEKDHQIKAAHAVLEGEEKERGRLSRDLHDGLGGMLSGVKLKLTNMKGNYILNEENVNQFDHAIDLLDNSIKELRRVAHNMMPEALLKFGLKDALQDYCDQLSGGKNIKVTFNFFGEHKRFDNSLEITVYRIAQELAYNALKHANATEILIQIVQEDNRIHLTVMDNGKGFDPAKVDTLKSKGLTNIRARVESFNGHIDIDSQLGKGTEIGVEFKTE